MQRERYQIADLTIDVEAASVLREGGVPLPLPRLSFDLLVALARRAPDVVRSEELIATVWAGVAVSDETLTQRVALLRRALGDEAKNPRYLRAVRGRGYQLVPEAVTPPLGKPPVGPAKPAWRLAAILSVLAVLLVLFVFFFRAQSPPPVTTRSPSVPELLQRAGSYLGQHQAPNNELAIELYQRALRMEPANARAMAGLSLALGQRATKFNQHGDAGDQALALARKALALDPRLGQAHHALGLALDSKGRVTQALAAYRRAAELDPWPANALASAAHLLRVQGHLAEALELNVRVAKAGGEAPIYLEVQMGETLALLGYGPAAAVWFERALELRPDNVFAAVAYARMRLSEGRLREAEEIAEQAIRHGVRRPELAEIRGTAALLQGDKPRAKALYDEALAIAPGFPRARTRLLLLAGAAAELQRRQWLEELRRGRAEGDEWPDAVFDEALLETGAGHLDAALQALDVAIGQGYRDDAWLLREPMLAGLPSPGLQRRIATIRRLVDAERQRVLGAGWLPPSLLAGRAARM